MFHEYSDGVFFPLLFLPAIVINAGIQNFVSFDLDGKIILLTRGMRQKLDFILTNIHEPEILLLDERFTGLDPENLQMMKRKLKEMKEAGIPIVLSTHILSFAADVCDRVAFIDKGEVKHIAEEPSLTEKKLETIFNEYIYELVSIITFQFKNLQGPSIF